jgi:hypothetical protein
MSHTPAPWKIEDKFNLSNIGYRAILDSDGYTICNPSPMGEANARLIAAAPDLLDALLTALPYVEDHAEDHAESGVYKRGTIARTVAQIRAAIEQATN